MRMNQGPPMASHIMAYDINSFFLLGTGPYAGAAVVIAG